MIDTVRMHHPFERVTLYVVTHLNVKNVSTVAKWQMVCLSTCLKKKKKTRCVSVSVFLQRLSGNSHISLSSITFCLGLDLHILKAMESRLNLMLYSHEVCPFRQKMIFFAG